MCRIAGIINNSRSSDEIHGMCDAMQRGGPDDEGFYKDPLLPVEFGHRRLSIIDLSSAGHQPMINDKADIVICYNGELFNYLEIKEELKNNGMLFHTHSDTEVILQAYKYWGKDCFKKFNGMYALAILDKNKAQVILARDHAGIKPLYYSLNNNAFYFASELRAFKKLGYWKENKDWKTFFLAFGHIPEPITTLIEVQPLPKGHMLVYDLKEKSYSVEAFYTPSFEIKIRDEKTAIAAIHDTLLAAIKRHLISDAPIGLFLSGGVDSSILTVSAKPFVPDSLHTLSIFFDSEKYSEKFYQDLVIEKTKAQHQSYNVTAEDLENLLPEILEAMDSPSIDGINSYFISKYAHHYGLKAVLSGLGADELLGGYQSFNRVGSVAKLKKIPAFILKMAKWLPDERYKRISYLSLNHPVGEYLFYRGLFPISSIASILNKTEKEVASILINLPQNPVFKSLKGAERAGFLEYNYYMQNQLLKDTDYMSMWHGLEVRVPFLDKDFIDLCNSIDPVVKFNRSRGKYLLIEAFKEALPEQVWNRKKSGFTFPFDEWFRSRPGLLKKFNVPDDVTSDFKNNKIHWSRVWSMALINNQ